jgi:Cu+-exporting ATPase
MDTLVSLSTVASWLFSSVVTFFPFLFTKDTNVFFDAGIFIIFFITLGKWLEARARYRTNEAVKKLVKLQVKEATLLVNGEEKRISAEDIKLGDILVVKPGQKIPTDGLVIKGNSTIDESMITGESIPSERSVKDKVIGSTLNITGVLYIKATKVGQDTLLSQIINLVQEAQSSQPPIQKLVDKISQRFVPIVIILSLIAFVFWFVYTKDIQLAVYIATSVLVIACPCALGLATPTAIIAGAGRAAQSGILIKDVQALENARQIKVVVFDKTGTITEGMPEVVNFKSFSNSINTKLMAYSLEKNSDHPLGKAITKFTKVNAKIFSVEDFENLNGKGIKGIVNGKDIYIVNPSYAKTLVELPDEVLRYINREENDGYTVVAQLEDKIVTGMYSLADVVKADSKKAIEELRGMGIKTIMLTGDNRSTAERIGKEVGVDRVIAQVLPQEKDEAIKNLKEEYKGVIAMVGDGINDAPALARADIGIAMGMGTDIAIEAGDVIIISGSLKKVKDLILISKKTINILHQNLYWAFGYNVIAIPIAMGLLYLPFNLLLSPIIASFTMAMSSVSVVSNSLRLRNVKI